MTISQKNGDLHGVYGWLRWLVITLLVLSPILSIGSTSTDIHLAESMAPNLLTLPEWDKYKTVIWSMTLICCGASFAAGWNLLKNHTPFSVRLTIAVLWMIPLASAFVAKVAAASLLNLNINFPLGAPILGAMIWTAYLLSSKRVKNTYY